MTPSEEAQVARGARGRALSRLIRQADSRAQRRFTRWVDSIQRETVDRMEAWRLYQQAEDLHSDLMRARHGGTQG